MTGLLAEAVMTIWTEVQVTTASTLMLAMTRLTAMVRTGCGLVARLLPINLSKAGSQNTGYGSDTLSNIENIQEVQGMMFERQWVCKHLKGGAGNDYLAGGSGHDNLDGGSGSDRIYIDAGNDTIDGGNGSDVVD